MKLSLKILDAHSLRGVGIYIGKSHVVGALLRRSGENVRLESYVVEPIQVVSSEQDPLVQKGEAKKLSAETSAIRMVMEKMHAKGAFARVGISPSEVVTRYFILPTLPDKEKGEMIDYEASRVTRLKLTESFFGYNENIRGQGVSTITVNAVKKRFIQSLIMSSRRGTAEVAAIEPAYVPLSRAFTHFGFSDEHKTHILVWFDGDLSVSVTLASAGMVFLSQDFRLTGDATQDSEKINDELQGSMRFLNENAGGAKAEILFITGFGDLEAWAESIRKFFLSLDVRVMRVPVSSEADKAISGPLVLAYGLALGELGLNSVLGDVTLLPPDEKKMRPFKFFSTIGIIAASISLFYLVTFFAVFSPIQHSLDLKKQKGKETLASFGSMALGSIQELEMAESALKQRIRSLDQFEKASVSMKDVLGGLKKLPSSIWLSQVDLLGRSSAPSMNPAAASSSASPNGAANGGRLVVQGYCYLGDATAETNQINEWAQNLAQTPGFLNRFPHLAVDEVKQQKIYGRSVTRFILTAEA